MTNEPETQVCPTCGTQQHEGRTRCSQCGASLARERIAWGEIAPGCGIGVLTWFAAMMVVTALLGGPRLVREASSFIKALLILGLPILPPFCLWLHARKQYPELAIGYGLVTLFALAWALLAFENCRVSL